MDKRIVASRGRAWRGLALLAALALVGGCQNVRMGQGRAGARPKGAPLQPGDARLDIASVTRPAVSTFDVYREQAGGKARVGTFTDRIDVMPGGDVVRVQRLVMASGTHVDCLVAGADLVPKSHHSSNTTRAVDLTYGPDAVRGTFAPAGSDVVQVEDPWDGRAFDSNFVDLVARALPFMPGLRVDVRTYERASAEAVATSILYTVQVRSLQRRDGRDVAIVEFGKGAGKTWLYVDANSRVVRRVESVVGPGAVLVLEPS